MIFEVTDVFATNLYGKLASLSGWFVIKEAGTPESFLLHNINYFPCSETLTIWA